MTTGLATGEDPDPSEHSITTYGYDSMNNPVSTTDALGKTSTAGYDLLGNMVHATDRNGNSVSYTYDALGRVKTVTAEDTTIAYEYNLLGQISKMTDSTGVTLYEYDGLGLLTKETKGNIIKTYDYDNNGNRTAFKLTENGEVTLNITYAYDSLNRLVSVTANGETTSYSYDANGNLISESTPGKAAASYSYNNANQLTALTNTAAGQTVASYSVSYYLDGNKSAIAESGQPTISYVYDGIGQLVSETTEGVSQTSYTYDSRQNRVGKTTNNLSDNSVQSISTYTYDLNNRLIKETETVAEVESTTDFYYDHNGNQITKLSSVIAPDTLEAESIGLSDIHPMAEFYTYDGLNRLSSATVNGKVTSYTYDGNNLRQTKTTDGVVTSHIYDGMNVVSDTVGTTRNLYVRGIALISGSFDGAKSYYHRNTHGDVIALTDTAGTISADYRYDAFGNQLSNNENDTNPFRYCGEYFDSETNNIYLRNRYYDTVTGRFITEDPIYDRLNWYVYCGNNPITFNDALGLEQIVISGGNYSDDNVHPGYDYNFIEPAIKKLNEWVYNNSSGELITWMVANEGWSDDDIENFRTVAAELGVRLTFFSNKNELFYYVNNKFEGENREDDKITKFAVFSHGVEGYLMLGYNYNDHDYNTDLNIYVEEIKNFSGYAFNNPNAWFYSCKTASVCEELGISFLQRWHRQVGGMAGGYDEKTNYAYITYSQQYNDYWAIDPRKWKESNEVKKLRKKYGFSESGSYRYPISATGRDPVIYCD